MEAQVKKMNGFKSARGFSLSEIEKAGLSVRQVRTLGVYVDPRRRTLHEFNVQTLKTLIEEHQKQLKEAQKAKEKVEEEEKKKKKKKKEKKVKKVEKKKEIKKEKKKEKIEKVDLTEIKGVGKKKAETLEAAGVSSVEELIRTDTAELAEKTGFSPEYIEKLKEQAKAL